MKGTFELSDQDLLSILKDHALENKKTLEPHINNYVKSKWGFNVESYTLDENFKSLVVNISSDSGNQGSIKSERLWQGLYKSVGVIIDRQRKRNKTKITFDDLMAELLEMKDDSGNKLFVQKKDALPMAILKQRLAPSQIVRQSKTQPNLKGVTVIKKGRSNEGLNF